MTIRPPTWMWVSLGAQLALALAGLAAVVGLGNAMAGHSVAFASDDVPLLFPAGMVVVLGAAALLLAARNQRALSTMLTWAPFPAAIALMVWSWW